MAKKMSRKITALLMIVAMVISLMSALTLPSNAAAGDAWTIQTLGIGTALKGICYGGSTFVAVGAGGTIITSSNGASWTNQTAANTLVTGGADLNAVCYGNGMFMAVGAGGIVLTSSNGVTWTAGTGASNDLVAVAFGNGAFVAIEKNDTPGGGGYIDTSIDNGNSWTTPYTFSGAFLNGICFENSEFVVVGDSDYITNKVLISSDGSSWQDHSADLTIQSLTSVSYGAGKYVTCDIESRVFTSTDGTNWISLDRQHTSTYESFDAICYGGTTFVIVGTGGVVYTSTDGSTWSQKTSGIGSNLRSVCYGNNTFAAVGDSGTVITSVGAVAPTVTGISPAIGSAAGGTSVIITGTNFTGATEVKFGTTAATFTFNSTTQITATAPAGADGSVDITVTTPGGTSATSAADRFTYDGTAPSAPVISGLTSASDTGSLQTDNITKDTTPTLTGTAEANSTVKLYYQDGSGPYGTATTDGSGNWSITASELSDGTYNLVVKATDAAGNTSAASSAISVTIDTTVPVFGGVTDSSIYNNSVTATYNEGTAELKKGGALVSTFGGSGSAIEESGSYVLTVTDAAGNSSTVSFTIDTVVPTITGVTATTSNGSYKTGDVIAITVLFSENVTVSGTPQLKLETGTTDRTVNYSTGSGSSTLTFNYTIQAGDTSPDLDYAATNALALNGGTIKDAAGNNATLTLAAPGAANSLGANKALVVDGVAPTVSSVSAPSNGTYSIGQNLDYMVNFSEAVNVVTAGGTPYLTLTVGSSTVHAPYWSGNGGSALTFRYTAVSNDADADGVALSSNITLNGGSIKDAVGNDATITFTGSTAVSVKVDGVLPTVTGVSSSTVDGSYKAGDVIAITVLFSENVAVTGTPQLTLETGTTDRTANYASGTGSSTLVFIYTIQSGDTSSDLDYTATNALTLNSGTIKDTAGNNATLTLAAPGAANSLGANKALVVDGVAPTVSISSGASGTTKNSPISVTITFSEIVPDFIVSDITVTNGTAGNFIGSGTTYTADITPSGQGAFKVDVAAGVAHDDAGNANTAATQLSRIYDSAAPTISLATLASSNAYIDLSFSEGVYGADDGSTALTATKFALIFTKNGGTATSVVISSVKKTDNAAEGSASALAGGETAVRVFLTITGTPNGLETIEVKPATSTSVFDQVGNAMLNAQTTGVKTLNDQAPPKLVSAVRSDNTHITVTLSKNCVSITKPNDGGFTVTETGTSYTVYSISQGADASHVVLITANMGVSAKEGVTVKYTAGANGTVQDTLGNVMATDGTGAVIAAWDTSAPTVSSIDRYTPPATTTNAASVVFRVTFNEAVTGVDKDDFVLTTTDSAAGTILGVSASTGTMIDVSVDSVSGMGTLKLDLKNSGTGIEDIGGNAITTGFTSGQIFTVDRVSPMVSSVSVPGNGKYTDGAELIFRVNYDEDVIVNTTGGTPGITLTIGATTVSADYTSTGSTSTVLKFVYTILPGQTDADGIAVGALSLNGGAIKDAVGNDATLTLNSVGSTDNVLVDTTAPTTGGGGSIAVSDLTSNSAKLTWMVATDSGTAPANLQYKVVYSTSNITSVAAADALSGTWTSNINTVTVSGLTANTDYYFNMLVKDEAGNKALYTSATGKTVAAPTDTTGGSSGTGAVVEVNGQRQDAGTANTQTTGGQMVTTVTVDDTKLNKILDNSGNNPTVTLPVSGSNDVVVGELNGQTVKNMEQKDATLEIKTDNVTYTLPASQINIDNVSAQIGSQVSLQDIKVSVRIAEPPADTVRIIEDTASKNSYQLVVKPVEFEISCTSGSKTIEVSKFNGYIERTVAIPEGVDPSRITTGIVLNADGTFRHVPTQIVIINGKYYAKINSLTNSTYSVIWNPVEFKDVATHWAKKAVNNMGSRMVVTGSGNGIYDPDRSITRAEFAAIVVRALGLAQGTTESAFGDVTLPDWFNGYVDTASSYGLITGYTTSTYGPNDTITREQAMAILARSMELTGLKVSLTDSEVSNLLSGYADGVKVSGYARKSVAMCIKSGVVTGTSATTLSPKANVTRAEVAVMVERLLKKSGLI